MSPKLLRSLVWTALFTALISAASFVSFKFGPIPFSLQSMFVLLAGLMLGWRWGLAAVALYLALGALGLPVFAMGKSGLSHLSGPTAGYLFGYLPTVFLVGILSTARRPGIVRNTLAQLAGTAVLYAIGATVLGIKLTMSAEAAIAAGVLPFLIGDAIKIAANTTLMATLGTGLAGVREPKA